MREIAIHAASAKSCVKRPERYEALAAATAKLVLVGYGHVGHGNQGRSADEEAGAVEVEEAEAVGET